MSLAQADRAITEVIETFSRRWLEIGLLVPTATGLEKSIMDAHAGLREFLRAKGLHDYGAQAQGARDHRVFLQTWLVERSGLRKTKTSLYRPETKSGDPRIWIYHLATYARPGNVLVLLEGGGDLYIVNGSDRELLSTASDSSSVLGRLLDRLSPPTGPVADELLAKLRDIARRGFVPTMRSGPTGVGFTLETMLGLKANSRKTPDYKGIEIKSTRTTSLGSASARATLFSKAPDWKVSPYNALRLVQMYGRDNEFGRKQIYCSLGNQPNATFGFYLASNEERELIHSLRGVPGQAPDPKDEKLFQWPLSELITALLAKHPETFWVKARVKGRGASESFHYFEVAHTQRPLRGNFPTLIDSGYIELDFLLHLKMAASGKLSVRDHGYLFKMWDKHRHLLFAEPRIYEL